MNNPGPSLQAPSLLRETDMQTRPYPDACFNRCMHVTTLGKALLICGEGQGEEEVFFKGDTGAGFNGF